MVGVEVEQVLRRYIEAMADPTRAAILLDLLWGGERTATQLARRLELTPNNVYHHMRVLRRLGVVEPPRPVPGDTYVEKYYRLKPEIVAAIRQDPDWLDRTQAAASPELRQAIFVSLCLTTAQLLRRSAQRYAAMDAADFDRLAHQEQLGMLSIAHLDRPQLVQRLAAMREIVQTENAVGVRVDVEGPNIAIMATLPSVREDDLGDCDSPSER